MTKMLCATRAIGRKVLEHSGIGSDYTHRNFSTILKTVSDHFHMKNEWKSHVRLQKWHEIPQPLYYLNLLLVISNFLCIIGRSEIGRISTWVFFQFTFVSKVLDISLNYRLQPLQSLFTSVMECTTEISEYIISVFFTQVFRHNLNYYLRPLNML